MTKNLILIQCKDQIGLVATISRILADHTLNITSMREFVDEQSASFFTRIECSGLLPSLKALQIELERELPSKAAVRINPNQEKKIAILVTKEYHCLADTLSRHFFKSLDAEVCCVIGNHSNLSDFTRRFEIPFHHVSHENLSKADFENEIADILQNYSPDYIVLSKFMRILSPEFIKQFENRIINIHHSFLPAFIGASPYRQAYERGVKIIGATAHFVTNDLDEGPIIVQQIIPVNHAFSVNDMVVAGKEVETAVLSKALTLLLQDRVFIAGNKTVIFE
ncbi:formyltetrahydrofolate deformylase [Flavihumibacter sp. R14]|nr:formyltetrahydrofolate deformylase [Flavihumibacter soli]